MNTEAKTRLHHIRPYCQLHFRVACGGIIINNNIPKDNHLVVSIANGSATLDSYITQTALLDLAYINRTDVMVISEPGSKATEEAITWGTHHIEPGETKTRVKRRKMGVNNRGKMPYIAYATHGLEGDGEGGVVVLVHEK